MLYSQINQLADTSYETKCSPFTFRRISRSKQAEKASDVNFPLQLNYHNGEQLQNEGSFDRIETKEVDDPKRQYWLVQSATKRRNCVSKKQLQNMKESP